MTSSELDFRIDTSDSGEIERHLHACDHKFHPSLSSRVDIPSYSAKLAANARCVEAWDGSELVGLVAGYINANSRELFISNVSVLEPQSGQGLATRLMRLALDDAGSRGCDTARLEVSEGAAAANRLYKTLGFEQTGASINGVLTLKISI